MRKSAKGSPPKSYAHHWWSAGLKDGKYCEQKRREKYYHEYLEDARALLTELGLIPIELTGPFEELYRRGFRLGYDNAVQQRERDKTFLPYRRKRAKLG
jgi:hypothetical protein